MNHSSVTVKCVFIDLILLLIMEISKIPGCSINIEEAIGMMAAKSQAKRPANIKGDCPR
jgi:hypothetical protein